MEWASLLCLGRLSYSFLSLDHPPTFYPLCFKCHELSHSSFKVKCLLPASLPLGQLYSFCLSHFPHLCLSLPSISSSSFLSAVSWMMAVTASAWSPVSSRTPCTFYLNFTSSIATFCFFLGLFPLPIIFFCKMSHGSITGRQRGNTATHFAVCVGPE